MIMGWDAANMVARRLICNEEGKLIIDPSEIFEDPPTDGEIGKAPNSNWAYDHEHDTGGVAEHYTDIKALTAWSKRYATLTGGTYTDYDVTDIDFLILDASDGNIYLKGLAGGGENKRLYLFKKPATYNIWIYHENGYALENNRIHTTNCDTQIVVSYLSCHFEFVYHNNRWYLDRYLLSRSEDLFDNTPIDSRLSKGITSNWAYDHYVNASAHHSRYTDDEARAAVGYNGTKYWSCLGIHFDALNPASGGLVKTNTGYLWITADDLSIVAHVSLPHGADVTSVVVNGNAASESHTWSLIRINAVNKTSATMAGDDVNTADETINYPTIDNDLYGYFLVVNELDTNDEIYSARIVYTI